MLFDPGRIASPDPTLLRPEAYGASAEPVQAGGRAAAWFVAGAGWQGVLRGYRRGGLVARISRAAYLWQGEERTRAFREFRLLAAMRAQGLRVPAPLAAGYWRSGLIYRAAILIERIPEVRPLAHVLAPAACEAAGRAIAALHAAGVWHADLNAFNILLDAAGDAWLIDFDRGTGGGVSASARQANLDRLKRSLVKVAGEPGAAAWDRIVAAYRAAQA